MPPIFKSWISEQLRRANRMAPSILNRAVVASWTWYVRAESTSSEITLPKRQQVIAHHSNSGSYEKAISKPISSSNSPLPGKSFEVSAISLRMNPFNKAYDGFSGKLFVIQCVDFSKFSLKLEISYCSSQPSMVQCLSSSIFPCSVGRCPSRYDRVA